MWSFRAAKPALPLGTLGPFRAAQLKHAVLPATFLWFVHFLFTSIAAGCRSTAERPHLLGHFLASFVSFVALSGLGLYSWFVVRPDDTLGGFSWASEYLTTLMVSFQSYEVLACLLDRALAGPGGQMLVHHVLTLALCVASVCYQFVGGFTPFFIGMSEISSIALAFVDVFKFFPKLRESFPATNQLMRNVFAVLFISIRVFYWPVVAFFFWRASLLELSAPEPLRYPLWLYWLFLLSNAFLTLMQLYWGSLIFKALSKMLKGGKDS
tara:strand:+ start:402 stop:1202 length:801 start_codon:yes stop_codon:yes gene_type:complete